MILAARSWLNCGVRCGIRVAYVHQAMIHVQRIDNDARGRDADSARPGGSNTGSAVVIPGAATIVTL